MIKDCITYLNAKLAALGYFQEVLCLVDKIERDGKVYPAQYSSNGEYKVIDLDPKGSICYWRKNGDVSISDEESSSGIGIQYRTIIPLKFVGFIKKDKQNDDQYFSDNIIAGIISNLTVSNSALKVAFKAKTVRISALKYTTDSRSVGAEEYDNIDFQSKYTHAYFSIDFELVFVTSTQCYTDICNDLPINFGYVIIKDGSGNEIERVKCGGEYICTGSGGGIVTVKNSNASFSQAVGCGNTLVLPDENFDVYVNSVLNASFVYVPLSGENINITG